MDPFFAVAVPVALLGWVHRRRPSSWTLLAFEMSLYPLWRKSTWEKMWR